MLTGRLFYFYLFKMVATSIWFTLRWLRRKLIRAKGNPSLEILEYSTPHPKLKTQTLISNFVGAKFSRWHLRINSFWRQLGSLLELSCWHLGITFFWCQLGSYLGLEIPGDSSQGFLFAFPHWGLLCLSFRGGLHISPSVFYYASPFLGNYMSPGPPQHVPVPLEGSPPRCAA